jgi:hypothetical protein
MSTSVTIPRIAPDCSSSTNVRNTLHRVHSNDSCSIQIQIQIEFGLRLSAVDIFACSSEKFIKLFGARALLALSNRSDPVNSPQLSLSSRSSRPYRRSRSSLSHLAHLAHLSHLSIFYIFDIFDVFDVFYIIPLHPSCTFSCVRIPDTYLDTHHPNGHTRCSMFC